MLHDAASLLREIDREVMGLPVSVYLEVEGPSENLPPDHGVVLTVTQLDLKAVLSTCQPQTSVKPQDQPEAQSVCVGSRRVKRGSFVLFP